MQTMDFRSKSFSFLLFAALISLNLAKDLNPIYQLLDNILSDCNDEESRKILESLKKVEKPKQLVKGLIVLTDSENIYEPLKNELLNKAAVFLPLHRTFKTNITDIYRNILFLESISFVKFVIHANSVEKIADMFQQFIGVFRNISDITGSVGIALTVNEEVTKINVITQLYKTVGKLNRSEAIEFVDNYMKADGPPIGIFKNQSSTNETVETQSSTNQNVETFLQDIYYSSRNDKHDSLKFNLDDHFQRIINCATDFVEKKVENDVETFVEENLRNYFDSLKQPIVDLNEEAEAKIARAYNHLLQFSQIMSKVRGARGFLKKLRATFKSAAQDESFIETYFLPQNINAIHFLFMTSEKTFDSALDNWTKPLKNFKLLNAENLKQWYQKKDGGCLLSRNFETNCVVVSKGTKMQVRGVIVRVSEINTQYCGSRTGFLEIFAMEKIFIDVNLDLIGREIQLAIIAPVWEIVGEVEINLNGVDGKNFMETATSGSETGNKNGADGLAGLPGGPAGSFYGIANKIINANHLTIFATGGNGGKGQDGGYGANGEDGNSLQDENKFNCDTATAIGFESMYYINNTKLGKNQATNYKHLVYGHTGKRGGRGGNGGAQGLGGNSGSILLFDLSKNDGRSLVRINDNNGNNGGIGFGGYSGLGGKNGNAVNVTCEHVIFRNKKLIQFLILYENSYASNGHNGTDGMSLKMRQVPKNASIVQSFSQTVNEYKLYTRPELTKINISGRLQSFYDSINRRQEITKLYDTLSLVEEFTGLELQGYGLEERHHLIPSFTILQQRIHNYSIKANYNNENSRLFQDIILGIEDRINDTLRNINKRGYTVMSDLYKGFEYLTKEVQELENQKKMSSQLETLNSTLNSLDDLTEEAKYLIGDELQTAMRDLEETLDQEINTLLEEISEMKRATKENEKELIKSREKLEKTMILKGLFGVMKIGCVLVGAINPALGLVATAGITTLSIVESQLTQTNLSSQVAEVPKSLKLLVTGVETFIKKEDPNKDAIIEFHISEMMRNVSQTGKIFIANMRERISNKFRKDSEPGLLNHKTDREGINKIYLKEENEITKDLDEATKKKDKSKINDYKIKLNVLKYLKVNGEVFQTTSDSFTSIMKDVDKVNELDQALKKSSDNLNRLYTIEEKIYNETEPLLKRMTDFVDNAYNNINDLNENQIIISEWNVENTIQSVQHTISKTFDGFNVTDEINWTLEKLLSAFQKLTKMHKNILDFQKRKSDAKFTAMFHLTKYSKILAQDYRLTSALIQLEMAIWYNKVNDIYKNWKFAFKQFSFPNGGDILKAVGWKDTARNDINSVVDGIISNVAKFKNFLQEDKNSDELLNNRAPRFLRGSCSSDESSFFVWTKDESAGVINDILSGKETRIVAYAPTSSINALKFNKVGILFTSNNPEIQGRLFEIMKTLRVNLTHHGDSHYRFNNKTFRINTNPTVLTFNYPKTCDEIMSLPSLSYRKIANGDCMLSPFATWTIKLYVDQKRSFPALEEFMGKVDLELIGEGTVFENSECNKECEATMMNNYKYAYDIYY